MAHGRRCLLAVVASVLVSGTPLRSTETITEVPFELYQRHLVVTKGSIGRLNNLNLLIDTGTIPSAVDSRIARKLRLQTEPAMLVAFGQRVPIQSAVVDGLRIGSLQSGPVPAGVGDLSYLQGAHVDAIVGLDVLARTNFSIDYRTRVLKFAPEGREDSAAPLDVGVAVCDGHDDHRRREGSLAGRHRQQQSGAVQDADAGRSLRCAVEGRQDGAVCVRLRAPARLDLRKVGLGAHVWDELPAWALDRVPQGYPPSIDGILGVMALGCQRVRFDFERNEFGWSR